MSLTTMSFTSRLAAATLATLMPFSAMADSDADAIKAQFEKAYPEMKIKSVLPSPIAGLYEVFTNGNLLYIDKSGKYVLAGATLVDDVTKRNITADRLKELTAIKFESLPFKNAIEVKKGSGAYHFAVFTDPDCPHCKTLEQGLEKLGLTDYTAYIFLTPVVELHPEAREKAESIWCAKDRSATWQAWMTEGKLPEKATCENPVDATVTLSRELGVMGTPTIYLANGYMAANPQELVDAIKKK